jgi:hypothetical protein
VLESGGVELLLRCANSRLWPDIVTAALWNICAESEIQSGAETGFATREDSLPTGTSVASDAQMSAIACAQLALISTGECDDSRWKSPHDAETEDGRRQNNIIKELLDLGNLVNDGTWKEMVAELLEKASWTCM